jgi:hypothetical protein
MTATATIHKSKWGFHPCSYETYRKLRKLNALYGEALKQLAQWNRWNNKAPHNRVIRKKIRDSKGHTVGYQAPIPWDEPEIDSIFLDRKEKKVYGHQGHSYKHGIMVPYYELLDYGIPEDYRRCYPVATAEEVQPLSISESEIDRLYKLEVEE